MQDNCNWDRSGLASGRMVRMLSAGHVELCRILEQADNPRDRLLGGTAESGRLWNAEWDATVITSTSHFMVDSKVQGQPIFMEGGRSAWCFLMTKGLGERARTREGWEIKATSFFAISQGLRCEAAESHSPLGVAAVVAEQNDVRADPVLSFP